VEKGEHVTRAYHPGALEISAALSQKRRKSKSPDLKKGTDQDSKGHAHSKKNKRDVK